MEPAKHKKTMSAGFESKVKVRQENTIGGNQMAGIKEECGVFGIYDLDGGNVVPSIYYGLTSCSTEDRNPADLQFLILRESVEM